jgi:hypothetical protein
MRQVVKSLRRPAVAVAMFTIAAAFEQTPAQADWCGGYDAEGCDAEAGLRCEGICQWQGPNWHCYYSSGHCEEFSCEVSVTCVS